MLFDHHGTRGQHPVVGRGQVVDQDVEVNPARVLHAGRAGGLEGEPLAVRGRLERDQPGYHCTGVPPSRPAQNRASTQGSAQSSTTSLIQPMTASSLT